MTRQAGRQAGDAVGQQRHQQDGATNRVQFGTTDVEGVEVIRPVRGSKNPIYVYVHGGRKCIQEHMWMGSRCQGGQSGASPGAPSN